MELRGHNDVIDEYIRVRQNHSGDVVNLYIWLADAT